MVESNFFKRTVIYILFWGSVSSSAFGNISRVIMPGLSEALLCLRGNSANGTLPLVIILDDRITYSLTNVSQFLQDLDSKKLTILTFMEQYRHEIPEKQLNIKKILNEYKGKLLPKKEYYDRLCLSECEETEQKGITIGYGLFYSVFECIKYGEEKELYILEEQSFEVKKIDEGHVCYSMYGTSGMCWYIIEVTKKNKRYSSSLLQKLEIMGQ